MNAKNIPDRVRGVLLGLAAGDRNGGPVRMAVRLAQSLATQQRFDRDNVGQNYLAWWQAVAFDTGPVAANVLKRVAAGASFQEAVIDVDRVFDGLTAGCNPAHRSPPLAMAAFIGDDDLGKTAFQEALLTHRHALAGEAAAATVTLCRKLIRGAAWSTALNDAGTDRTLQIRQALQVDASVPPEKGGFAPHVLQAAVYFVNQNDTFTQALEQSLNFAGAPNYCPVLVGAIGGARWGAAAIPKSAVAHCRILHTVQQAADMLAEQWS